MVEQGRFADYLFAAVIAALVVTLIAGAIFGIALHATYATHFPALSLPGLIIFFACQFSPYLLAGSLLLMLFTYVAARLFTRLGARIKRFAFFISAAAGALLCFWLVFWLNARFLRYSRELRSYLLDLGMVVIAIAVFLLLLRLIPATLRPERSRALRWICTPLAVLLLAGTQLASPFAVERFASAQEVLAPRNYSPSGNYLGTDAVASDDLCNILLLSIDTLRSDGLGCYGNPRPTSPQIDSLAAAGVLFTNALAHSSWTLPSHMTMITGLQPSVHGCNASPMWTRVFDRLDDHWVTLPEVLRGFGYATAAFTDGRLVGPAFGFDQGFDVCDDSGRGIARIADKAIDWLEGHSGAQPFFLFLHCYDVHHYRPPEQYASLFVRDYQGRLRDLRQSGRALETRLNANAFRQLSADEVTYIRDLYDAEIRKTDTEFGRVLQCLRERGLGDDALLIVTSDHGEEFWEHCGTGHGWSLHQHQLRIPLIIRFPGLPAGRVDAAAGLVDLVPTILDLVGLPVPSEAQGISLVPACLAAGANTGSAQSSPAGGTEERVFLAEASHLGNQKCLIAGGHAYHLNEFPPIGEDLFDRRRFIYVWRNILNSGRGQLYDLRSDPGEFTDLIAAYPERAERMRVQLLELVRRNRALGQQRGGGTRSELDAETREHLKSLGYID